MGKSWSERCVFIMVKIKKIISGVLEENCYVVYDSESLHAVIIDPGEDGEKVISEIEKDKLKPEMLVNTHGHYDHILSDDQVRLKFKIPLAIHKYEAEMLASVYKNGSKLFGYPKTVKAPDNTQYSQETGIHALGRIRTHNPSKRTATESLSFCYYIDEYHDSKLKLQEQTYFKRNFDILKACCL